MIASGYSMILYCDHIDAGSASCGSQSEFTGETRAEARVVARKAGWKFPRNNPGVVYCPHHTAKKTSSKAKE